MSESFLGQIIMVGFNFAPVGYAMCDGSLLAISQNTALFALLGTTYGGDGVTTFALPDLRGRVPINPGQGPGLSNYDLGDRGGAETQTLSTTQMPSHNHPVKCNTTDNPTNNQTNPSANYPAAVHQNQFGIYSASASGAKNAGTIGNAGGGQPVSILQPYLGVQFVIATSGIFPSRA